MSAPGSVTVVGCGVAGLTTATVLRSRGFDAHIIAAELPFDTVSIVAGAIWSPTRMEPADRVAGWALRTREVLETLATDAESGVAPMVMRDLERSDSGRRWGEDTPYMRRLSADETPDGYDVAFEVNSFRIDPPTYLRWMIDRFERSGGTIELRRIDTLAEAPGETVVNCTGLGARELIGDDTMFPIRGQVVAVANPGIDSGISDESDPERIAYVYPRIAEMVLGGTRDSGRTDPDPTPAITERILAQTAELDPRVAGLDVVVERVGFRPGRPEVRLDAGELSDGRMVVHNYGHGGAGYIMSWGCAEEVADLIGR